jgi:methyl-accepting chemotaxis protein
MEVFNKWGDILEVLVKSISNLGYAAYTIICAIVVIFFVSLLTMVFIRGKYRKLQYDLASAAARRDARFRNQVLSAVVDDYKAISLAARGEVNTQAIIEKNFSIMLKGAGLGERFVRNSVSLMVVLGLLGTFYGLTMSVGRLVELLSTSGNSDVLVSMDSIITGLISSVRGMAVAFSTSLAGVGGSIVITVLGIVINIEESRQSLMVQLEYYLDNIVEQELLQNKESELSRISKTIVTSFDGFSAKVEDILRSTVLDFSDKLAAAGSNIENSSKCLEETIVKFENALSLFSSNTRDFSEFNHNLRGNIERMDVAFMNLRESIAETSKNIASNQEAMNNFSAAVQQAAAVFGGEKGIGSDGR